jgi:hypothetical protein
MVPAGWAKNGARLVTWKLCQRRHPQVPPHTFAEAAAYLAARRSPERVQTIPRCIASHTAVLSRTPRRRAPPQWAIHAAIPSAVPEA